MRSTIKELRTGVRKINRHKRKKKNEYNNNQTENIK